MGSRHGRFRSPPRATLWYTRDALNVLPIVAFFASGASSLIFQALWTRMLHHTFGATSVAMSSVLTAFMAGLGLGAHLFGRRAPRLRRPLVAYALCELGVAAAALAIPELVRSDGVLASVNAQLRLVLGGAGPLFMLARFLCVLPVLIIPTTLMGATLPLLSQHFARTPQASGRSARAGALYAINTFGGVMGVVLGSFVLMPSLGVHTTNLVAVGANALLGISILVLHGRVRLQPARQPATAPQRGRLSRRRRLAGLAFAISGACAMIYEVVWSRALAMAIGSSMQAFALILVTFLIGIALGSALLASLPSAPLLGLGLSSVLLTAIALAPAAALESPALALLAGVAAALTIGTVCALAARRARALRALEAELGGWSRAPLPGSRAEPFDTSRRDALAAEGTQRAARRCLLIPCLIATFELVRFGARDSRLAAVTLHGYLPFITTSVVFAVAAWLWISSRLRHTPWLLAAAVQCSIAASTLVGCLFQDEIPYSFARLVSSLSDLSQHVGSVRFFMFLTAGLCTLPATLGMGAMFPITLRLWRPREQEVGRDVGQVYAANTIGSIVGAWLPGFVLMPALGMQTTLLVGMLLNAAMGLALLLAGRRELDQVGALRPALGLGALALPVVLVGLLISPPPGFAWNLSHMTLGAFRISLAREVLNPQSWGNPDLVYYRDGVSTTVSVERWGRHLSLKNNGKVDASNGNDMPTQIMVAAYPLLLHRRGPSDLDVAVVGFGSGVTVGAALQFPVRHVDAIELERAVVEAGAMFFADVSHLPRRLARFPYVREPRLTLHNDDGRNFLAAAHERYDVIISEPSNPWITGVADLFTTEHFRITKRRLKPGGVYCQWVQLYEMSPANIKTIYRTFASQFRYVLAFAAEELSSDTILVGSDAPFPLEIGHVAEVMAQPRVARELARAYVHSAYDVWSRMLFASREEVMRFTQRELRRSAHGFREARDATGAAACPPDSCRRTPAPLNTDDNMLIELRAPADLIGFSRYEGYLSIFYGSDWPYGQVQTQLRDLRTPGQIAEMALALLAQGRQRRAHALVTKLDGLALEAEAAVGRRTARLLLGLDPEPAFVPEPPSPTPQASAAVRRAFAQIVEEIEVAIDLGDYQTALGKMEALAEPWRKLSGPGFRSLHALLLHRAAGDDRRLHKRAAAELEDLLRKHGIYARAHPELYYFLARALQAASSFDKAVRNMRWFARQLAAGRPNAVTAKSVAR